MGQASRQEPGLHHPRPDAAGHNGYRVCELHPQGRPVVPIIMLTARSQEADKIRGLEVGADDYVTKPFSVGELVARIRAIFRRMTRTRPAERRPLRIGKADDRPGRAGAHPRARRRQALVLRGQLLKLLHERAGQPVSRDEILDKMWGIEAARPPTGRSTTSSSSCARSSSLGPKSRATSSRSTASATSWWSEERAPSTDCYAPARRAPGAATQSATAATNASAAAVRNATGAPKSSHSPPKSRLAASESTPTTR